MMHVFYMKPRRFDDGKNFFDAGIQDTMEKSSMEWFY